MTDIEAIKSKIAKLLRMQESGTPGEAANAASLVERLCREHGLTSREVSSDYDAEQEAATDFFYGEASKRLDPALCMILNAVTQYFNGCLVRKYTAAGRRLHVFATQANQIQIELYTDYLMDTLKTIADRECPKGDRAYRNNFKKGFATVICSRLNQLISERHHQGIPETNTSALVCTSRDQKQHALSVALQTMTYPRLRSGPAMKAGTHGFGGGKEAAKHVGLQQQVTHSKQHALPGGTTHG